MKKSILYIMTVILFSISVYAYSVSVTWNFDQPNFDYEAYVCANPACIALTGGSILTGNSGASTSVTTTYSAVGTQRTAFFFFADNADDKFRTKGAVVTTNRAANSIVTSTFNKKNSCQANITDISTAPIILDSGMNSTINVTVNSPFRVADSDPGMPTARPANRTNFFGADTVVNVTVKNTAGTTIFSDSQTVTLAEDEARNVSFNWNNMPTGNVTITANTQVTDSQCNLATALADTRTENFTVLNLNNPPVANAGPDKTVAVNTTVTFDGSASTDSDGFIPPGNFFWDFNDGTNATGAIVTHNFTTKANFTVTLTVTDNQGATANDTALVQVDGIPSAVVSGPTSGFTNQLITFNGAQSTDDGNITNYNWAFGDGGTGSGITTTHTYTAPGTYTVTLNVTDNNNLTDADTLIITITQQTSSGGQSSSSRRSGGRNNDRHNVRITDVVMDKELVCGQGARMQVELTNTGDFDENLIGVSAENKELSVKDVNSVSLDQSGKRIVDLTFDVPENIPSGDYDIKVEANFGRGTDFTTQKVSVQCNTPNEEVVTQSFVPSESKSEISNLQINTVVMVSVALGLIVVILALVYFLI